MRLINKKSTGFTLIEMIIVIVVVSIIIAGSSTLMTQGFRSYIAAKNITDENWQSTIALESMARDLHAIRSKTDISFANNTNISFTTTSGSTVNYSISGSMIVRTENGTSQNLADNLPNLTFQYYNNSSSTPMSDTSYPSNTAAIRYITVNLGLQTPEQITVYPWNLR